MSSINETHNHHQQEQETRLFSLSLLLDLNISSPTLVLLLLLSIVCHLSQIDLQDYEMVNGIGNYTCWPVSNIVKEKVS